MTAQDGKAQGGPAQIAVLVADGFMTLHLDLVTSMLRIANRVVGNPAFAVRVVTPTGNPVSAPSGEQVFPDSSTAAVGSLAVVFVIAGFGPEAQVTPESLALLRRAERSGAVVGAVGTGPVFLGDAGLLDGRSSAVHWEHEAAFRARNPRTTVITDAVVEDGRLLTCPGGLLVAEMMTRYITMAANAEIARRVAAILYHGPHHEPPGRPGDPLEKAERLMRQTLAEPLSLSELARLSGAHPRTLTRHFRSRHGSTPMAFYRRMRLEQARLLLRSGSSVRAAAEAAGFHSAAHFSESYRSTFGTQPSTAKSNAGSRPRTDNNWSAPLRVDSPGPEHGRGRLGQCLDLIV